jgi:hypothetical protein
MSTNDDELSEFTDEVTDGTYNLPCVEMIFKLVKKMQAWGDERIKKIVAGLLAEGIKISIANDIWYSYSYVCAYFYNIPFNSILCLSPYSSSGTFSCLTGGRTVLLSNHRLCDHRSSLERSLELI